MFGTEVASGAGADALTVKVIGNTEMRQEMSRTEVN